MLKLNIIAEGGNYATIGNHIKSLGLDTSHFLGQAANLGKTFTPPRPIEDYLENKFPIKSAALKRRLLREKFFPYVCSSCGNFVWMGETLPLELHHKDGNNQNNRLDNLSLLCPNCHALTDNYRGKNIKSGARGWN